MKSLRDIPVLENIPVLVRMSQVVNTVRIQGALPTIKFLQERGARVVLISHMSGEDAGTGISTGTLASMHEALKQFVPNLSFCPVSVGQEARAAVRALPPGGAVLLENLRRNAGEVKNTPEFAAELAELADVFVEDAFDTCHRVHASIVGVPKLLPSYAGFQVEKEVAELDTALRPKSPALAIIGGAKFSTKEPVISKLLATYEYVFVGGALANDFLAARGFPIGASMRSDASSDSLSPFLKSPKLVLPLDSIVAPKGASRNEGRVAGLTEVADTEAILDVGPKTLAHLRELSRTANTILWNGPLGNFENGFTDGTTSLASFIADSSAHSIVGGGDTIAAIEQQHASERFSFISTGGGAMLEYLADGTLPGIAALD